MQVERTSLITGNVSTMDIDVTQEALVLYASGTVLIQDVFPTLSLDEREFIKTGITPEEWDAAFPDEDDEYIIDPPF
jgi:hypothetical protein